VIPGNDDALRAIRLFASKIADSVVEGSQVANKQAEDLAAAAGAAQQAEMAAIEAPAEGARDASSADEESGEGEDISMEDVLGAGTRKQPAAAKETASATADVDADAMKTFN